MWAQLNWMQWPSENDNEKVYFACVDKPLLLGHPRNCPLVPVDDFPVSCGYYVYLLVISRLLDSILWYVIFTFYYLVFALYFLVFALCLIKLHCSQPILKFKNFFFVFSIMKKNRLHSNNSLSSETVSVSVYFFPGKKKYLYIQTFNVLHYYIHLRNTHQKAMS